MGELIGGLATTVHGRDSRVWQGCIHCSHGRTKKLFLVRLHGNSVSRDTDLGKRDRDCGDGFAARGSGAGASRLVLPAFVIPGVMAWIRYYVVRLISLSPVATSRGSQGAERINNSIIPIPYRERVQIFLQRLSLNQVLIDFGVDK